MAISYIDISSSTFISHRAILHFFFLIIAFTLSRILMSTILPYILIYRNSNPLVSLFGLLSHLWAEFLWIHGTYYVYWRCFLMESNLVSHASSELADMCIADIQQQWCARETKPNPGDLLRCCSHERWLSFLGLLEIFFKTPQPNGKYLN